MVAKEKMRGFSFRSEGFHAALHSGSLGGRRRALRDVDLRGGDGFRVDERCYLHKFANDECKNAQYNRPMANYIAHFYCVWNLF